jgi:uncharacterized RDD family membrane protein YckC
MMSNIKASNRIAPLWRRLGAAIIDLSLLEFLSWILVYLTLGSIYAVLSLIAAKHGEEIPKFDDYFNPLGMQVVEVVFYCGVGFFYTVIPHFKWGQTLGKKIFNIKVVTLPDYQPISFKQSLLRWSLQIISLLIFGLGYVMALLNPRRQTLHESIAGVVVIQKV